MSKHERHEMKQFVIMLNMAMGIYNLSIFIYSGSVFNLVIGSLNLGVFIFFRHELKKLV